jgi:hypothetical protein
MKILTVSPQWSDFVLTSDVPNGKADVLVLDGFDVETNGGNGGDDFSELQFVQDSGLTGGIETDHQNTLINWYKVSRR